MEKKKRRKCLIATSRHTGHGQGGGGRADGVSCSIGVEWESGEVHCLVTCQ